MVELGETYKLRDVDGTVLGVYRNITQPGGYEVDLCTGMRKETTERFFPLTVSEKPLLGQIISTEIGEMRVAKPLSSDYERKWPDSVFVERVIDQSKVKV